MTFSSSLLPCLAASLWPSVRSNLSAMTPWLLSSFFLIRSLLDFLPNPKSLLKLLKGTRRGRGLDHNPISPVNSAGPPSPPHHPHPAYFFSIFSFMWDEARRETEESLPEGQVRGRRDRHKRGAFRVCSAPFLHGPPAPLLLRSLVIRKRRKVAKEWGWLRTPPC